MYKVFVNNKPLLFAEKNIKPEEVDDASFIVNFRSKETYIQALRLMTDEELSKQSMGVIRCENLDHSWTVFSGLFDYIEAAGGVVKNKNGDILLIKRPKYSDFWDLPKGKKESGEDLTTTALREIKEECGLLIDKVESELPATYHVYSLDEKQILKKTQWYQVNYSGDAKPTPQLEEGITEIRWFAPDEVKKIKRSIYPSLHQVLFPTTKH